MGERLLQKRGVPEAISNALFEFGSRDAAAPRVLCQGRRSSGCRRSDRPAVPAAATQIASMEAALPGSLAAHRTIVNSRLQRTDHGHRQIIHAWSPSMIEKKMIWARPTIFSNGT